MDNSKVAFERTCARVIRELPETNIFILGRKIFVHKWGGRILKFKELCAMGYCGREG